jgi:hypothetical protein
MTYARTVHLNTDVISLRLGRGLLRQGVAIAKADFQHYGRRLGESVIGIGQWCCGIQAEVRPKGFKGFFLAGGHAAFAAHKTAYGAFVYNFSFSHNGGARCNKQAILLTTKGTKDTKRLTV